MFLALPTFFVTSVLSQLSEEASRINVSAGYGLTTRGCNCTSGWMHSNLYCLGYCCNPDNEPSGPWCKVEDADCQGTDWGTCAPIQATTRGCYCQYGWSYRDEGDICDGYCCNPDNSSDGPWCKVQDMHCDGSTIRDTCAGDFSHATYVESCSQCATRQVRTALQEQCPDSAKQIAYRALEAIVHAHFGSMGFNFMRGFVELPEVDLGTMAQDYAANLCTECGQHMIDAVWAIGNDGSSGECGRSCDPTVRSAIAAAYDTEATLEPVATALSSGCEGQVRPWFDEDTSEASVSDSSGEESSDSSSSGGDSGEESSDSSSSGGDGGSDSSSSGGETSDSSSSRGEPSDSTSLDYYNSEERDTDSGVGDAYAWNSAIWILMVWALTPSNLI